MLGQEANIPGLSCRGEYKLDRSVYTDIEYNLTGLNYWSNSAQLSVAVYVFRLRGISCGKGQRHCD